MAAAVVLGLCTVLAWAAWSDDGGLRAPWADADAGRWAAEVAAFERTDREHPPPPGGIVVIGSSSIGLWHALESEFPRLPILRRGVGGSTLADCLRFIDSLVLPYAPRLVVIYAGDNDLSEGASPEDVLARYLGFVDRVHRASPQTRIAFMSIKASPVRARLMPLMERANALVAAAAHSRPYLSFVDVYHPMLGAHGRPNAALFLADGLHPNAAGYALWKVALGPHLN
jgi:lysophospholipase L1-like esterase